MMMMIGPLISRVCQGRRAGGDNAKMMAEGSGCMRRTRNERKSTITTWKMWSRRRSRRWFMWLRRLDRVTTRSQFRFTLLGPTETDGCRPHAVALIGRSPSAVEKLWSSSNYDDQLATSLRCKHIDQRTNWFIELRQRRRQVNKNAVHRVISAVYTIHLTLNIYITFTTFTQNQTT